MWLKKFIKDNLLFFYPFAICLFAGAVILFLYSKGEIILAINSRYSPLTDVFFRWYTHVGDGITSLGLTAILLLFVSKEKGLVLGISHAVTSIPVQLIKLFAFADNGRPRSYFKDDISQLHFVDGVDVVFANSFPSGHTASAFSMFLVLSYWLKNQSISFLFFWMAFLVGYSRVYLAQHFFADAYAGGLFAVFATILVIYYLNEKWRFQDKESLKHGFISGIR